MGTTITCYGARVGLRATSAEGLRLLRGWLPRAVRPGRTARVQGLYSFVLGGAGPRRGVKRLHLLYRDSRELARTLDLAAVRRAFERDLSVLIGDYASRRVFVHAGVVAVDGAAVLIPGKSLSGKSTLTRALVEQGATYYSDEFAVLDARGRVVPWAEPLSIREDGMLGPGTPHALDSLGIVAGRRALPVRLVVLTAFEKGRRFKPQAVRSAAATLGLLAHTLPARRRPKAVLRLLTLVASRASVVEGARGEAREAARAILRLLRECGR